MSVETPDMDELLRLVPTVGYGDDAPADRRGGALHLSAVLPAYFSSLLADRRATANVVFNEDLYSTIDTGAFYEKLVALRSEAAQEPAQAQQ